MTRRDTAPWRKARTCEDISELTAQWLEGKITYQPGYHGGPDEETLPLVPVLAAACRAGFITLGSQPGWSGNGWGASWEQRAWIEMLAPAAAGHALTMACQDAGLHVIVHAGARPGRTMGGFVPVTLRDGVQYTWAGAWLSRRHLRSRVTGYGTCRRSVVRDLCGMFQVSIIDLEWDREDSPLWTVLDAHGGRWLA